MSMTLIGIKLETFMFHTKHVTLRPISQCIAIQINNFHQCFAIFPTLFTSSLSIFNVLFGFRSQSLQNQYILSNTDYVCSPNNLSNTSSRRSPIQCSYNDNYLTDITELNYTQSLESNSDEVLDLSLHNRKQDTLEGSYTLPHEVHTPGRSNIPWMKKPDISLKPPVFTPINTSDTLCSSYTNTNMLAQSEADIKLSNQEFNLNNILHDIYSLPIMQHMKTLPTPINNEFKRDTTTGTTISNNNPLNILPLPANTSNINKMFPVHSTIPTTLIQKKNSYKDAPKLITCPIAGCQQKFPWNSSLKRHILTHTRKLYYFLSVVDDIDDLYKISK